MPATCHEFFPCEHFCVEIIFGIADVVVVICKPSCQRNWGSFIGIFPVMARKMFSSYIVGVKFTGDTFRHSTCLFWSYMSP